MAPKNATLNCQLELFELWNKLFAFYEEDMYQPMGAWQNHNETLPVPVHSESNMLELQWERIIADEPIGLI